MTTEAKPSRLRAEINELAAAMHANGTLATAMFEKITACDLERTGTAPLIEELSKDDIIKLREEAHMSQAAFARSLNLTASYIAQLERGSRRPTGASLLLLNIIRRKGLRALL